MFGVGLQFHFRELLAVRRVAVPGALAQIVIVTALGAAVLVWAGGTWPSGIVYGFAISLASSVVLIRVLSDHDHLHTPTGHSRRLEVLKDLHRSRPRAHPPVLLRREGPPRRSPADILCASQDQTIDLHHCGGQLWSFPGSSAAWQRPARASSSPHNIGCRARIAVGSAKVFGVSMALGALAGRTGGRSVRFQLPRRL